MPRSAGGAASPPWPGELGQRVFENVSAEAWKLWEERMKMILNEYRLMPFQKEAQELVPHASLCHQAAAQVELQRVPQVTHVLLGQR